MNMLRKKRSQQKLIVFLHPHFNKPGGATRVVLEQATRLKRSGFNVRVLTTTSNSQITSGYSSLSINQLSNYPTGDIRFWISFPKFYREMKRILHADSNVVLYCHSLSIYWGWVYKSLNPGIKLVYYLHDLGLPYTDSPAEISGLPLFFRLFFSASRPITNVVNRWVIHSADILIANSKTTAKFIDNKYRIKVDNWVYPGVDVKRFKSGGARKDQVVLVGRLEKLKNIQTSIKALYICKTRYPLFDTKLYIVGEGPEKQVLKDLAQRLGLSDQIVFAGQVDMNQIPRYYSQSRASIALCPHESFGLSAAESICSGTPVVGIRSNGISEVVTHHINGELCEGEPEQVASAIMNVLERNNFVGGISSTVLKVYRERFSWETQISKLSKIFLSL